MTAAGKKTPEAPAGSPWRRIFLLITGFLILFLVFLGFVLTEGRRTADPWTKMATRYVSGAPSPNALGPMLEAMRDADQQALAANEETLRELALTGRTGRAAEVGSLLKSSQPVVIAVSRAAVIDQCHFPGTADLGIESPRPRISDLRRLGFLLVANARQLAAGGHGEEAVQRLVEAALFGARFTRPEREASLTSHLAGILVMELSVNAMLDLIRTQSLPREARLRIAAQLDDIATLVAPVGEALHAEAALYLREINGRSDSAETLAEGLRLFDPELGVAESRDLAAQLLPDAPAFPAEQARVWKSIDAALVLPVYKQPRIDTGWFRRETANPLVLRQFTGISDLVLRVEVLRARLRLAQAALLQPFDLKTRGAFPLPDPFAPEPIKVAAGRAWSVGPDGVDQGGAEIFDPAKGFDSSGDIVIVFAEAQ